MMFYKTSSNNYHACIFCIYWDIVHFSDIWNKTAFEWLFHLKFEVLLSLSFHIAYSASHLSLQQKLTSLNQSNIVCVSRTNSAHPKDWFTLPVAVPENAPVPKLFNPILSYQEHMHYSPSEPSEPLSNNKILIYFHPRPMTHNPWRMMYNTKCMNCNSKLDYPLPIHPHTIS